MNKYHHGKKRSTSKSPRKGDTENSRRKLDNRKDHTAEDESSSPNGIDDRDHGALLRMSDDEYNGEGAMSEDQEDEDDDYGSFNPNLKRDSS